MINLIENLCRTCMGEEESVCVTTSKMQTNQTLFSIFNGQQENTACGSMTIKELLEQAIPQLSIDKDDPLPKSVCKNCLDNLVNIHQFQQKCLLAEQRLQDLANESSVVMRVMDNEDDPLTDSKIPDDFTDVHNILKVEIDEPLIVKNVQTNIDIVTNPKEIDGDGDDDDDGGTNGQEENSGDDVEHDITSSKKSTRKQKLAKKQKLDNLNQIRIKIGKLRGGSKETVFACHHRQKKLRKRECQYENLDYNEEEDVALSQLVSDIIEAKSQDISENNDLKVSQDLPDQSEKQTFACDQCGSRLKTLKSLNRHQKMHQRMEIEKKEPEEPEECTWQFESGENTDDEDYDPHDICENDDTKSKKLKSRKPLKNAQTIELDIKQQVESSEKSFECDECGSRVKTQKSLNRHKRIHRRLPGEKPQRSKTKYECKYCQKVFTQSSSLKDHERVHTGEKPFLCSECGKAFRILSNMKQHFNRHGTDRPYECPDCPKKFPCLTDLASHAAVHNKAKTHVCDICGSAFVKPYLLKKHKMYHAGEKNHKCDYCDMRFVLTEQCRRHMRTHTGEKPYKCKYCSRAFAQSNDLSKHLRVHLGDSVYKCDLCPQGFRLLGDLRAHFNTHKNEDDETRQKNLQALKEDELRLQLRFGLVQTPEDFS